MKSRYLLLSVILPAVIFPVGSGAQEGPASRFLSGSAAAAGEESTVLMGKVAVEGGSDVNRDTTIVLRCRNYERASVHPDNQGQFTLLLKEPDSATAAAPSSAAAYGGLSDCGLRVEAPGYRPEELQLVGSQLSGIVQIGTIVLHPLARASGDEGFVVNAASLAAPNGAKKNFEKGQEQAKKGKWAAACDYFRRAVQVYPRYALAWLELGRAQMQQNNFVEAEQSFHQATAQDSNLMPAYMELTRMAIQQKQWKALADATDQILRLSPESSAVFWFLNAAANFNMGDISRAESSVTRGLRLDVSHKTPQLEYLYGTILAEQQNYEAAAQHIKAYLQLAPRAADAHQAEEKLSLIESQLSASKNSGSR